MIAVCWGAMTKNILLRRTLCSTSSSATTPRIRYFGKPDRSKYLPFAPCNSLKLSQEELERLPPQVRQVLEPKYWDGRTYLKANIWNAVLEFQRKPGDTGSAEVQGKKTRETMGWMDVTTCVCVCVCALSTSCGVDQENGSIGETMQKKKR